MKADILLTHPDYLFVHKPSGMLTISDRFDAQAPTLMALVQQQEPGVLLLHRLDRDTSGVIAYARHAEAQRHAAKLFETRAVEKIYLGIVQGSVTEVDGLIDAPIAEHPYHKGRMIVHHKLGKPSQTRFTCLENFGSFSLVQFELLSGRTHQIRVHMQDYGHPLVGDATYGSGEPVYLSRLKKNYRLSVKDEEEHPLFHRMALHASRLFFLDAQGSRTGAEAPLPKDMQAFLKQLRKWTAK